MTDPGYAGLTVLFVVLPVPLVSLPSCPVHRMVRTIFLCLKRGQAASATAFHVTSGMNATEKEWPLSAHKHAVRVCTLKSAVFHGCTVLRIEAAVTVPGIIGPMFPPLLGGRNVEHASPGAAAGA